MSIIVPANTQQVFQMSPFAEKALQTTQQQSAGLAQQLNQEDNLKINELKSTEVQDTGRKEPSDLTNPDGKKGQGRLRTKKNEGKKSESIEVESEINPLKIGSSKINKIDVVV